MLAIKINNRLTSEKNNRSFRLPIASRIAWTRGHMLKIQPFRELSESKLPYCGPLSEISLCGQPKSTNCFSSTRITSIFWSPAMIRHTPTCSRNRHSTNTLAHPVQTDLFLRLDKGNLEQDVAEAACSSLLVCFPGTMNMFLPCL